MSVTPRPYVLVMDSMAAAARRAARQHGVVTRRELLACGLSDRRIGGLVRRRLLVRVAPGTFLWAGSAPTWRQQALAAVKACGPRALLSHQSGAALHELEGFRPGRLHVSAPTDVASAGRWTTHKVKLSAADRAVVDGIPVARVALVLVQVAATVSARRLEDAFDDALCRRLVTLDDVSQACQPGRPGSAALRAVAALWRPGDRPATLAEARLVRRLAERGLPRPVLQHEVRDGGALVARIDLAFPDQRVAVEYDSFRWHEVRRARAETLARRNRLEALGWHVLVATEVDLADGGARLAAALGRLVGVTRDAA